MNTCNQSFLKPLVLLPVVAFIALGCNKEHNWQNETVTTNEQTYPIVVKVNGMYCDLCSKSVERYLSKLPEVDTVRVSLAEKKVSIKLRSNRVLSREQISKTIAEAGYETKGFIRYPEELNRKD